MKQHYLVKILGLNLAFVPKGGFIGNCFSPAIVIQSAGLGLTIRTRHCYETTAYWFGGLSFSWNSAHLARWFGEEFEAPHGTCWRWHDHYDI